MNLHTKKGTASLSSVLLIHSVFPNPPIDISLSSPHQPAEILPKYAHLDFIFLPPSPSLFPSYFLWFCFLLPFSSVLSTKLAFCLNPLSEFSFLSFFAFLFLLKYQWRNIRGLTTFTPLQRPAVFVQTARRLN